MKMKNSEPQTSAESFYAQVFHDLNKKSLPFLVGGTYAFSRYTDIVRETHDLDLFCKAGDHLKLIQEMANLGYKTEVPDARWVAKIKKGRHYIDIIFGTAQGVAQVDDSWFEHSQPTNLFGVKVKLMPVEEMIWSKSFMMDRFRFDGADIQHLIIKKGANLDWKRLLNRMDPHWELLFAHLVLFRFVYPSERELIPKWLIKELLERANRQQATATPQDKISRGKMLSRTQYEIDNEWGFKDIT